MTETASETAEGRLDPALRRLAGVLSVGVLAAALDTTIVNVAIARLGVDLHSPLSTVQWVSTGYLLSFSMVIPLVGWLLGRLGTRDLWLGSMAVFLATSVACGAAASIGMLIVFRVIQGAAGGTMLVMYQAVLAQQAAQRQLTRVIAIAATPAMLAPILGPIIGGLLVTEASWRWVFYVNVPVCALGLLLAWHALPGQERRSRPQLDLTGLVLLAPGLALVVYGLSEAGAHGRFSSAAVLIPLAAGAGLLAVFSAYSLRTRRAAILDLRLLRFRAYSSALAVNLLMGLGLFGALFLLPLYYQQGRAKSALDAGVYMIPLGVGFIAGMLIARRMGARSSPRALVVAGVLLTCAGTIAFTQVPDHPNDALLGASLFVRGVGMNLALVSAVTAVYMAIEPSRASEATSAQRIFQQVGGSVGTAVLAVILQRHYESAPNHILSAFGTTFWWILALTAIAIIPAAIFPTAARDSAEADAVNDTSPPSPNPPPDPAETPAI